MRLVGFGLSALGLAAIALFWWTESGPYAWLLLAENAVFDATFPSETLTGLIVLAILPALYVSGPMRDVSEPPSTRSDGLRQFFSLFGLALACGAVALIALMLANRLPDGSEPPIRIDLVEQGGTALPTGMVTIEGTVLTDHIVSVEQVGEYTNTVRYIAPIARRRTIRS